MKSYQNYLNESFGFSDQLSYENKITKLEGKEPDERLKIIWQWVIEKNINFAVFKELIQYHMKIDKEI